MKPTPENIQSLGPHGTQWFGGSVDRIKATLRIMPKPHGQEVDASEISRLLGCESNRKSPKGSWGLRAPDGMDGDLDSKIQWILGHVTRDQGAWAHLAQKYRVDLFCGLFLERPNRGVGLSASTLKELGARGIDIGFDIYSPENNPKEADG